MSYNRGSGYYTSRYGSGGPPKKFGANNSSYNDSSNSNAPAASSGLGQSLASGLTSASGPGNNPPGDKNRSATGAYSSRRSERDYYGGYRSRYDSKYHKYAGGNGPNGPNTNPISSSGPSGAGTPRNSASTYYGSASATPSASNPPYKRRPNNDRYDSYTGGKKYYSSSVSSNGIEESNPKTSYSKYPATSQSRSPEWKSSAALKPGREDTYKPKPSTATISTNKFLDERRGKSANFLQDKANPEPSKQNEKRNSDTPFQPKDSKMSNFFDDGDGIEEPKRQPLDTKSIKKESNEFVKSKSVDIEKVRRNSRTEDELKKSERRKSISAIGQKFSKFPNEQPRLKSPTEGDRSTDSSKPKALLLKGKETLHEPEITELKASEPEANNPKASAPETIEPKTAEPKPNDQITAEQRRADPRTAETIAIVPAKQPTKDKPKTSPTEYKHKPKENKTSFSDYLKSSKEKKIYVHSSTPKEENRDRVQEDRIQSEEKDIVETKETDEISKEVGSKLENIDTQGDDVPQEITINEDVAVIKLVRDDFVEVESGNDEDQNEAIEAGRTKFFSETAEEPTKETETLFVSPTSTATTENKSLRTNTDADSGDTSTLSPVRHSASVDNFNFNNLATISELVDNEEGDVTKNDLDVSEEDNESDDDSTDPSASEAETVITSSPPALSKARRLIRKKDYDETRHNLKRKAILQSDDEDINKLNSNDEQLGEKVRNIRPYTVKRDSGGRSLLQRACKKGQLEEIKDFLAKGADANEMDYGGFTCLHEAALEGHNEVVRILIKNGANVNARADAAGDSETPLIDAAENMHLETVKILLEHGADPSIYNIDGFTALTKIYNEHADEEGYEEIIKVLENANAKFIQRNKLETGTKSASPAPPVLEDPYDTYFGELIKKKGIFKFAAEGSKEVTANYFVSGNGLSSKPDILIIAARNGHVELVDIILGLNPTPYNIDTENECGATALLASVGRGHFEVVESLLSKDADPTKKRKQDGLNSLEIAQRSIHFDQKEVDLIQSYVNKNPKEGSENRIGSRVVSVSNSAATSTVVSEDEMEIDSDNSDRELEDRKRKFLEGTTTSKKLKKSKSESKIKIQPSEVFKRLGSPESYALERTKSLEQPLSPQSKKVSASPSPSPAPLSKAQEEQKAKSLEQARVWQEKTEAKKRARRDLFLKSEKEKERKRKEEEERRIEEEKKLAELREQEKIRLAKEAHETAKILQKQKKELMQKHTKETYPIGLSTAKFGVKLSQDYILQYAPLYVFDIEGVKYVTDLQVALMTGSPVIEFAGTSAKHLTSVEKSKIWELYFYMVGVDKNKPYDNLKNLKTDGYEKFQNLLISFVNLESVKAVLEEKYPLTYNSIWGDTARCTEVDLEAMSVFRTNQNPHQTLNQRVVSEVDMEVVVDTKTVSETFFVPPKLRRRRDTLRAISTVSRPMW